MTCLTCDGDGYVDIVNDWGGVIGPAPCPDCAGGVLEEAMERTDICGATSWQVEGFAVCVEQPGHEGRHVWEVE